MMNNDMGNKVVIVTGSSGGFGKEIARQLVHRGAKVVVTSRTVERAEQVATELNREVGANSTFVTQGKAFFCDYSLENTDDAERLISTAIEKCGCIDALVNNAISHQSLPPPKPFQDIKLEELRAGISSNLENVLWLTAKAYPHLKKTKGTILNIGSAVVNRYPCGIPIYTIIKGAMQQMTKVLSAAWASDGIRVNQINPGFSESDAYKSLNLPKTAIDEFLGYYKKFHGLKRTGTPKDIAPLVVFLLSDSASWITGSIVEVDGGYSVQSIPFPGSIE